MKKPQSGSPLFWSYRHWRLFPESFNREEHNALKIRKHINTAKDINELRRVLDYLDIRFLYLLAILALELRLSNFSNYRYWCMLKKFKIYIKTIYLQYPYISLYILQYNYMYIYNFLFTYNELFITEFIIFLYFSYWNISCSSLIVQFFKCIKWVWT